MHTTAAPWLTVRHDCLEVGLSVTEGGRCRGDAPARTPVNARQAFPRNGVRLSKAFVRDRKVVTAQRPYTRAGAAEKISVKRVARSALTGRPHLTYLQASTRLFRKLSNVWKRP